ncbi:GNAT family N-acetyltransferase [Paenibacillus alvei]|uniref:GNAT family N-acetyltransferase n=1 Tax=Paenibacillus TaxID=44249 RepID=UPI000288DD72|nr:MULTISPECIES: GNAT family N-acetyltransferase [Paenibacillus]EJW15979.1 putative GCN5 N-acetyltransferase [Paenibacillus alvei DSM 29]MCY9540090.1 GNAT family N-acetyltransferase [Paenibacillus alvei]MCY9704664.1 GNAT family N-acetyltransferase [Paenibacillus alvei]MCY9732676.1 GNAT family N-acetyltransferase [Paenibacillus alvei]MCY9755003.1 GNAT family N-acetyltransferase [Paenibacillus alvei]
MKYRKATGNDHELILNLWDRSVTATHHFLKLEDKLEIREEIPLYFPHLDVRLWFVEGSFVGFSGTHQNHLEMLFLDPDKSGRGYGTQIIQLLIKEFGVNSVDVNKDNERAKMFYLKNGFSIVNESPTDSSGRPYPILHLKLQQNRISR